MFNTENFIQQFKEKNKSIEGKRIFLRPIRNSDINLEYLSWLNSNDITQFLESRFTNYTLEKLEKYVSKINEDNNILFLSIITKNEKKWIGTIKLGPINQYHYFTDLGIMIGNSQYWGKGYATEVLQVSSDFVFKQMKLHKIHAGVYDNNLASINAFLKSGFIEEGRRKKHLYYKSKFIDYILLAKFNPEFKIDD